MKKFLIAIVALVVLSAVCVYAQTKVDVVYLKNGETLKGRIVKDVPFDYLELQIKDGTIKKVFYQDMKKREVIEEPDSNSNINYDGYTQNRANEYPKRGSIGFGFGIPYGLLGVNGEYMINDYFSADLGIGYAILGLGVNIGGRTYLTPRKSAFRPMVDVYYGTNGIISAYGISKTYAGISGGVGFKWMYGRHKASGLEFELIYLISSAMYDEIDRLREQGYDIQDNGKLKISVGYRFGF
ncbi:MAG: hypothetical protein WCR42_10320 [bacterium]